MAMWHEVAKKIIGGHWFCLRNSKKMSMSASHLFVDEDGASVAFDQSNFTESNEWELCSPPINKNPNHQIICPNCKNIKIITEVVQCNTHEFYTCELCHNKFVFNIATKEIESMDTNTSPWKWVNGHYKLKEEHKVAGLSVNWLLCPHCTNKVDLTNYLSHSQKMIKPPLGLPPPEIWNELDSSERIYSLHSAIMDTQRYIKETRE